MDYNEEDNRKEYAKGNPNQFNEPCEKAKQFVATHAVSESQKREFAELKKAFLERSPGYLQKFSAIENMAKDGFQGSWPFLLTCYREKSNFIVDRFGLDEINRRFSELYHRLLQEGTVDTLNEAASAFEKLYSNGDKECMTFIEKCYHRSDEISQTRNSQLRLAELALSKGDLGTARKSYIAYYTWKDDQGDTLALLTLASLLENTLKSPNLALKFYESYYRNIIDGGSPYEYYDLAKVYERLEGPAKALPIYTLLFENLAPQATFNKEVAKYMIKLAEEFRTKEKNPGNIYSGYGKLAKDCLEAAANGAVQANILLAQWYPAQRELYLSTVFQNASTYDEFLDLIQAIDDRESCKKILFERLRDTKFENCGDAALEQARIIYHLMLALSYLYDSEPLTQIPQPQEPVKNKTPPFQGKPPKKPVNTCYCCKFCCNCCCEYFCKINYGLYSAYVWNTKNPWLQLMGSLIGCGTGVAAINLGLIPLCFACCFSGWCAFGRCAEPKCMEDLTTDCCDKWSKHYNHKNSLLKQKKQFQESLYKANLDQYHQALEFHKKQVEENERGYQNAMIKFNEEQNLCSIENTRLHTRWSQCKALAATLKELANKSRDIIDNGHFATGADIRIYQNQALDAIIEHRTQFG